MNVVFIIDKLPLEKLGDLWTSLGDKFSCGL